MNLTTKVQAQEYLNKQLNERLTQLDHQSHEVQTQNDVKEFFFFLKGLLS